LLIVFRRAAPIVFIIISTVRHQGTHREYEHAI
jgi:hypothetical protein